jgi:hypothetical protein
MSRRRVGQSVATAAADDEGGLRVVSSAPHWFAVHSMRLFAQRAPEEAKLWSADRPTQRAQHDQERDTKRPNLPGLCPSHRSRESGLLDVSGVKGQRERAVAPL